MQDTRFLSQKYCRKRPVNFLKFQGKVLKRLKKEKERERKKKNVNESIFLMNVPDDKCLFFKKHT